MNSRQSLQHPMARDFVQCFCSPAGNSYGWSINVTYSTLSQPTLQICPLGAGSVPDLFSNTKYVLFKCARLLRCGFIITEITHKITKFILCCSKGSFPWVARPTFSVSSCYRTTPVSLVCGWPNKPAASVSQQDSRDLFPRRTDTSSWMLCFRQTLLASSSFHLASGVCQNHTTADLGWTVKTLRRILRQSPGKIINQKKVVQFPGSQYI